MTGEVVGTEFADFPAPAVGRVLAGDSVLVDRAGVVGLVRADGLSGGDFRERVTSVALSGSLDAPQPIVVGDDGRWELWAPGDAGAGDEVKLRAAAVALSAAAVGDLVAGWTRFEGVAKFFEALHVGANIYRWTQSQPAGGFPVGWPIKLTAGRAFSDGTDEWRWLARSGYHSPNSWEIWNGLVGFVAGAADEDGGHLTAFDFSAAGLWHADSGWLD